MVTTCSISLGHPHLFLCFSSVSFAKVGSVGRQKEKKRQKEKEKAKVGQNVQRHEIKAY